jgi:prophage maintenance system killer protein
MNGYRLVADQVQATLTMLSVASGAFSEEDYADWIRKNMKSA